MENEMMTNAAKGTMTVLSGTIPLIAQTVVDDKTAVNILYVAVVGAFSFGVGSLVTQVKNKQRSHDEAMRAINQLLERANERMERIELWIQHLPCADASEKAVCAKNHNHYIKPKEYEQTH